MKTILVPTDFSTCSNNAVNYAIGLAEKFNSKIIIHHSCHLPTLTIEAPFEEITEDQIFSAAKTNIKDYFNNKNLNNLKIEIEENISFGLAVDNIVSISKNKNIDLIVMGTKGASNIEELMLGSNTSSVMEKAPCPVIAVPQNAEYKDIKKMVFATDYQENDILSISFLSNIAKKYNSEILVVHESVVTQTDNLERDLFKKFKNDVLENVSYENISFKLIIGFDLSKDLNLILEENNADILAISTRKRNIFIKFFERSLTKKMTHHTKIPIIAFHSK